MRSIGILGGMGPDATAELYRRLIQAFQGRGALLDSDFPNIFINSLPAPDIPEREGELLPFLLEGMEKLQTAGAEVLTIPCNTATCILEKNASVPGLVNIVEETVKKAEENGYKKVGILSTKLTLETDEFQSRLRKRKIEFVLPSDEESNMIMEVIMNILAGKRFPEDKARLEKIAARMVSEGADSVILGCTELPLLFKNSSIRTLDTIQILAEALVERCVV